MRKIILLLLAGLLSLQLSAQFGSLGNKVANKVKDHMIDKAADAIADKIISKWNEAEQEALKKEYDSIQREDPDAYENFEEYKRSLNKNPYVQDEYQFDLWMDIESTDGNDSDQYQMFFNKNNALLGMKTIEEATAFTVIDYDNDIMIIYTEDEGEKNMQALPSFQKLAGSIVYHASMEAEEQDQYNFEKTGKTKNIAGYKCDEYSGESDEGTYTMYISSDFPISWDHIYGKFYTQYLIQNNSEISNLSGMMMEYIGLNKKGKVESTWEVKEVKEEIYTIHTEEYLQE